MIPVLYNHAEKDFISNGLGRLVDCISCIVTEQRNGEFKCEFEYPIFGRHYADLKEGCIIFVTHDNSGIPQPFDIYSRSVPINGVVTFEAAHISYRLGNVVLKPYTATSCASALEAIPGAAMNECEFSFITDKNVNADFALTIPTAAKAILCGAEGSILDVYGTGEYRYDKFLVNLKLHRGTDTNVQIRYGKNLVDMTDDYDSSTSYNAVVPYWVSPETNEVVTLPEYAVIADAAPSYVDFWTDDNGAFITDENDERFEFDYVVLKPVTLDLSQSFKTKPTLAQMRKRARDSANDHVLPSRSISVDFVQLGQSEEYAEFAPLQELNLCDTAVVCYFGESVRLKVIKTEYDVLRDRYTLLELGNPPESYADVVTGELSEKLKIAPSKSQMQAAITTATEKITGVHGGNVVIDTIDGKPWRILVMDTDDVETAVNVLQINKEGIGLSRTGVNGEYVTAWTIDGTFVADFIRTGTLSGDLVKAGVISSVDNDSYWDLDNGVFYNLSGDTNGTAIKMQGGRVTFYDKFHTSLMHIASSSIQHQTYGTGIVMDDGEYIALGSQEPTSTEAYLVVNGTNVFGFDEGLLSCKNHRIMYGLYFGKDPTNTSHFLRWYDNWNGFTGLDHLFVNSPHVHFRDGISPQTGPSNNYFVCFSSTLPVYVQATLTAQTLTQRSDEHQKNIRAYESAYDDIIDDLEPITYTWKDDADTSEHVGLGARKTRAILDAHGLENAGFAHDIGGTYMINYNELTVMLLKRVQDLTKRVEELEAQLCR